MFCAIESVIRAMPRTRCWRCSRSITDRVGESGQPAPAFDLLARATDEFGISSVDDSRADAEEPLARDRIRPQYGSPCTSIPLGTTSSGLPSGPRRRYLGSERDLSLPVSRGDWLESGAFRKSAALEATESSRSCAALPTPAAANGLTSTPNCESTVA